MWCVFVRVCVVVALLPLLPLPRFFATFAHGRVDVRAACVLCVFLPLCYGCVVCVCVRVCVCVCVSW